MSRMLNALKLIDARSPAAVGEGTGDRGQGPEEGPQGNCVPPAIERVSEDGVPDEETLEAVVPEAEILEAELCDAELEDLDLPGAEASSSTLSVVEEAFQEIEAAVVALAQEPAIPPATEDLPGDVAHGPQSGIVEEAFQQIAAAAALAEEPATPPATPLEEAKEVATLPNAPAALIPQPVPPSPAAMDEAIVTLHAAAYHQLADNLLAHTIPGHSAAMLFTSPEDGVGKTRIVARLAFELARRQIGPIVAVDANFAAGGLASQFGAPTVPGLTDVLMERIALAEAIHATTTPLLSVLSGGSPLTIDDPGKFDTGRVIRQLVASYAFVLIDTASLTHPWVGGLVSCCEGTYLVVRLGQTIPRMAHDAAQVVQACRGRLQGCVVVGSPHGNRS